MKRYREIDVMKGMGIIFMIMGHQYYGVFFDKWIHAFHMPMFFIISGFLYHKPESVKNSILKKVKTLLIPYGFFAGIHFLIMITKTVIDAQPIKTVFPYLYHILWINTEGLPICGAIWFLTAMFFSYILFMLVDKYMPNFIIKSIFYLIVMVIGLVLGRGGYRLPFSLDVAFVGVGLYYIGEIFRKIKEYISPNFQFKLLIGIVGIILSFITIYINNSVNLRLGIYGNNFLFVFNATIMAISLYFLSYVISKSNIFLVREISYIGKNSIVYLGFNQLLLIFLKKITCNNSYIDYLIKIIALIICLFFLHVISYVLSNNKTKILIGK